MTEICDRTLRAGGPAILFERPPGHSMPVLGNLFGTPRRVAWGMGADDVSALARGRRTARQPEGTGGAEGPARCARQGRDAEERAVGHGTAGSPRGARAGSRLGRQRRRPGAASRPDLLAGRRRPADHLGTGRHPRAAQEAAEPRDLPPAGDRPQQADHALAGPPRRRARLPRPRARQSGHTVSDRGGAGRGPGHHARAPSRRCPTRCRSISSPDCCAARAPRSPRASATDCRCRQPPRSCWKGTSIPIRRTRTANSVAPTAATKPRSRARSATTPAITTRSSASRSSPSSGSRCGAIPIYHSTYTGKPPDEPAILGVALNEVFVPILRRTFPGDRRLLPAARRLQLPHGGRVDAQAVPGPREARDVRRLELPAAVHVHEVHRRHRRGHRRPRLEGSDLGHHHAGRSGARHRAGRQHADRLPRLRLAGVRARQQDGHRRDQQDARRDATRVGPADRDGRGDQGARRLRSGSELGL